MRSTIVFTLMLLVAQAALNGQKLAAYRIDSIHAGDYRYFSYVKKNGKFLLGRLQSEGQLITLLDIPSANGRFNLAKTSARPKGGFLAFITDTAAKEYNRMPNPLHDGLRKNGVLKMGREANRKLKDYLLSDEASASLYRSSKFYKATSTIIGLGGVGLVIGGIVVSSSEGSSTANAAALLGGGAVSMFICQTLSNAGMKKLKESVIKFNTKHPRLVQL
jgi:hypothetical protein